MASFGILMTLIADIFVRTTNFGRQIVLRAKIQADARNSLEAIARAVRVSNIDYELWGGTIPGPSTVELKLVNPATGFKSIINWETDDAGCYNDGVSFPCVVVTTDNETTWAPLTPKGVRIETLNFYISPDTDPFAFNPETGTYANDSFPYVVIDMSVHGIGKRPSEDWVFNMQTSVTPRLYLR